MMFAVSLAFVSIGGLRNRRRGSNELPTEKAPILTQKDGRNRKVQRAGRRASTRARRATRARKATKARVGRRKPMLRLSTNNP